MADPSTWPSVLVPSSEDWSLRGGTRSGGQTFQGQEPIIASPTARWKASLTIPCMQPETVLAMRQVIALGRTQVWIVGPVEVSRAPWNVDFIGGRISYAKGIPGGQDTDPALSFKFAANASINGTSLSILREKGGVLSPGMLFQLKSYRMHVITALPGGDPGIPGRQGPVNSVIAAEVRPWLRDEVVTGDPLEFGAPRCLMRLASDDTGAMELQLSRLGTVTVDLIEAF